MKKLFLFLALALSWVGLGQPVVQTTAYTRYWLLATNGLDGVKRLGFEVDTIAQLVALPIATGSTDSKAGPTNVWVNGYTSVGDGGGGQFWAQAEIVTVTTNYGTLIRSTSNTNMIWHRNYIGPVNVRWFGVTTTGDQTARINSAYSAISTDGGVLYFPAAPGGGTYLFNLVVTDSNIQLVGDAASQSNSGGSRIGPYDKTKPVVQIGNDSGYVYGSYLRDLTVSSTQGSTGIYYAGGAYMGGGNRLNISGFTNGVYYSGGTNYECSLINLNQSQVVVPHYGSGSRGIVVKTPTGGTKWTTGISFSGGCHINAGDGYVAEIDGTSVNWGDSYLDMSDQVGLLLDLPAGTNSNLKTPYITGSAILDAGSSQTNRIFKIAYTAAFTSPSAWVRDISTSIGGSFEMSDGSVYRGSDHTLMDDAMLTYPAVVGGLSFQALGYDGKAYSYTNNVHADSSENLIAVAKTNVRLQPGTGVATVEGPTATFRILNTSVNKGSDLFSDSGGNLNLWPIDGTSLKVLNAAGNAIMVTKSGGVILNMVEDPTSTGIPFIFMQASADYRTYIEFYNSKTSTQRYRIGMDPDAAGNKRFGVYDGTTSAMRWSIDPTTGDMHVISGDLGIDTAGKTLSLKTGSNAAAGSVTLTNGQATVFTTALDANSIVFATIQNPIGTFGGIAVTNKVTSTSFEIRSSSATDGSTVGWWIMDTQ